MKGSFRNSFCLSSSSWTQLGRQHARFLLDPTLDVSCPAPTLFCALDYQRYLHIFASRPFHYQKYRHIFHFSSFHRFFLMTIRTSSIFQVTTHGSWKVSFFSTRKILLGAAYRLVPARSLASCDTPFSLVLIYCLLWIAYRKPFQAEIFANKIFLVLWMHNPRYGLKILSS